MTGISKKIGVLFVAVGMAILLCLSCICMGASAKSASDLTLICEVEGEPIKGMRWEAFRIGSFDGEKITIEGEFAKYPVYIDEISASAFADAASTLRDYAFSFKIKSDGSGTSKNDGSVTFRNLENGVYLVAARLMVKGEVSYYPTPALVVVDYEINPENVIYPKISTAVIMAGQSEYYELKKIWENSENLPYKPTEIVVDLYRDFEFFRTVTLTEENDWFYSWENSYVAEWSIIERRIPEGCCVIYRNDGRRYVMVNTYVPDFEFDWEMDFAPPVTTVTTVPTTTETTTTTTVVPVSSDVTESSTSTSTTETTTKITTTKKITVKATTTSSKLPQTGQLWWPVPVMAISGLLLMAAGTRIISSKRDEDE